MSSITKTIVALAVVAGVISGAILLGNMHGNDHITDDHGNSSMPHMGDEHSDHTMQHNDHQKSSSPTSVRGLSATENGLTLSVEKTTFAQSKSSEVRFKIVEENGQTVRNFPVIHEKPMHLIIVRRDGKNFQHLHPQIDKNGSWYTSVEFMTPGSYRLFADFQDGNEPRTLATDLSVSGKANYKELPAPKPEANAGNGYRVTINHGELKANNDSALSFSFSRNGKTVRTQKYLGAGGHLVALREDDLAFLHVHPTSNNTPITFNSSFPSSGRYILFLQFKANQQVHTAAFTVDIKP